MASTLTLNSSQGGFYYKNQALIVTLLSGRDISTGDTHKLLIKNPYGYTTEVTSTYNTTDGKIRAEFSTGYFNVVGQWVLKAFDEGEQIQGENAYLYINERWEK